MFLTYTVCFVLALLIHEACHGIAAYACRIPINEFGFGWGPRLYGFRLGNSDYVLRAIPIGAYVRFSVVDLQKRRVHQQVLVFMAGVIGNLIAASVSQNSSFIMMNYLLAATNILPLYQQDGWKCGIVMLKAALRRTSPVVDWTFTIAGTVLSFAVLGGEVLRRFQ